MERSGAEAASRRCIVCAQLGAVNQRMPPMTAIGLDADRAIFVIGMPFAF